MFLSNLVNFEDDENFLKRVLSGPVVTEGSDLVSVYEAAGPDLGINPSALHTLYLSSTSTVYLYLYFVARCNCVVRGKLTSQTPQLFSELRI